MQSFDREIMNRIMVTVAGLLMSTVLLTSCSDGNWGSDYHSTAKEQVKSAGIDAKVIAGKMTSNNDFVTIEFKGDITRNELFKSVEALSAMDIPENADRRVEWKTGKVKGDSILMFNNSKPNLNEIEKLAQVVEASEGKLDHLSLNLNSDGKLPAPTPQIIFTVDKSIPPVEAQVLRDKLNKITEPVSQPEPLTSADFQ